MQNILMGQPAQHGDVYTRRPRIFPLFMKPS
jgi:hypothetical protein